MTERVRHKEVTGSSRKDDNVEHRTLDKNRLSRDRLGSTGRKTRTWRVYN